MPDGFGKYMAMILDSVPRENVPVSNAGGRVRVFFEEVALDEQTAGDKIAIARLPKGAVPLAVMLLTTTSLGTTTVAIHNDESGDDEVELVSATTFTDTNEPTLFGEADAMGEPLEKQMDFVMETAEATMPSSGTLRVAILYMVD